MFIENSFLLELTNIEHGGKNSAVWARLFKTNDVVS